MTGSRLRRSLESAGKALIRLLAPEYCAACDAPVPAGEVFCGACGECPPPPADVALGALAGGAYAPPLSTALRRFKFGQRADLAGPLSQLLPTLAVPADALVVPVPLHLTRLVERGYNAPALLAARWCRRLGVELAPWLLSRERETPQQARLPAHERAQNLEGAFIAHGGRGAGAAGRPAILLDDVVTTGATLAACRRALYAAGVVHVSVIALAATPVARLSRG